MLTWRVVERDRHDELGVGWLGRRLRFGALQSGEKLAVTAFELGDVDPLADPASIGELVLPLDLVRAVPRRRAEYLAGRLACAMSLEQCGYVGPHRVGRRRDRSPIWPDGYVGSVTHGGGVVAAAAAQASTYAGVGIDAEPLLSERAQDELRDMVLTHRERVRVDTALPELVRGSLVTLAFSAKECLFKCLYPLVGKFFEFHDAELMSIRADSASTGEFRLGLARRLADQFLAGWETLGRFSIADGRVETAIALRRGSPAFVRQHASAGSTAATALG